ncbi:TetR/AcrR family transcriptional regulator [Hyphomonas sp. FCG-A18]|uniref:TetR/AcrR family transcriptional regulator n=1 Tax=Hyphomonas sp. FCG-A18 TaxID=3080019 RepID=UPI002B2E1FD8|nr:TetR/AcrR family transcriptional regulator [Hyphomonas sp. FCG-A18]
MRDRNTPGRPREFDDTEMLRKIMTLFWQGGYEGISLSRIMKETGLQKASLYAAFGDKRALYLKALSQYHTDVVTAAATALETPSARPETRIQAFLSAPLDGAATGDRSGCFLCNASADQADLNTDTQKQVTDGFDRLTRALCQPIAELNPDLDAEAVKSKARTLLSIYTGLRIMVRSGLPLNDLKPITVTALELAHA